MARIYQDALGGWICLDGEMKLRFATEAEAQQKLNEIQFRETSMGDKITVAQKVRVDMRAFIDAARALQSDLEDLSLLGFMPDGDDPIADADLASEGITAVTFFAGVSVFAKIAPTPTLQEQAALARLAKR